MTGVGFRVAFLRSSQGHFYLEGDGGYLHGRGYGDGDVRPPGISSHLVQVRTNGDAHPVDFYGYSLSVALGLEAFGRDAWGSGLELGYRYQDGTRGITAHHVELGFSWSWRF